MNEDSHAPAFHTWSLDALTMWAQQSFKLINQQQDTIEQLRMDNKDLSKINRELLTKGKI